MTMRYFFMFSIILAAIAFSGCESANQGELSQLQVDFSAAEEGGGAGVASTGNFKRCARIL